MKYATAPQPDRQSQKGGKIARNVMNLGIGQIATGILGFFLTAALGRSLGPANFGIYYTLFAIYGFVGVMVDWGQATYVIGETARGRPDEPEFIGSALLIRLAGSVCAAIMAAGITLAFGYDEAIVWLAPIVVIVGTPLALSQAYSFLFRGRDRMDLETCVAITGKAVTLAATLLVLYWGASLLGVLLAYGVGGLGSMAAGVYLARRIGFNIRAPAAAPLRELLWAGIPFALFSSALALLPFIEVLLLSRFTSPDVVGWYAAARGVLGIVIAPAAILATASFPEVSRMSSSVPDLRRLLTESSRLLLSIAALTSAALYLFADHIVMVIYGRGDFQHAALLLRVAAPFFVLQFLGFLLGSAVLATGKSKQMAKIKIVYVAAFSVVAWILVDFCQQRFGNGAIALFVTSGLLEIFLLMSFVALLPRGVITSRTLLDLLRALLVFLCTAVPLLAAKSLSMARASTPRASPGF